MLSRLKAVVDKVHVIMGVVLVASLALNFVQMRQIERRDLRKTYDYASEQLVDRAIRLYAAETKQSFDQVLEHRHPVAVTVEKGTCVNLRLPANAIGWMPVYCFDKTGRLTYRARV